MGRSLRPSAADGLPLKRIGYSSGPIFAVPLGRITFCKLTALEMSAGERPREKSFQIEVDVDLAHLASDRQGDLRALHGGQAGAQEVGAEVEDLLLGESGAGEAELE